MHHLLACLSVAVVVAVATFPYAESVECYNCVTNTPDWATAKCKGQTRPNCVFCTKASFAGSLVVRGCVIVGNVKQYTEYGKLCETYKKYFAGNHTNAVMKESKDKWNKNSAKFDASCTKTGGDKAKKGYVCKKNRCNAAPRAAHLEPSGAIWSLSSALFFGFVGIFGLRPFLV